MLCQSCHKNLATVRYAEVVDGHVKERHMCPECLTRQRERQGAGFEFETPSAKRPGVASQRAVVKEAVRKHRSCPVCGKLLQRILDERRLGCASCYGEFAEHIDPLLMARHGSVTHKGKQPHITDARERLRADLQVKRSLLRAVLQAENYEEAALLRDEIRGLELGLSVSESGAD